jgi:hypothetical protein
MIRAPWLARLLESRQFISWDITPNSVWLSQSRFTCNEHCGDWQSFQIKRFYSTNFSPYKVADIRAFGQTVVWNLSRYYFEKTIPISVQPWCYSCHGLSVSLASSDPKSDYFGLGQPQNSYLPANPGVYWKASSSLTCLSFPDLCSWTQPSRIRLDSSRWTSCRLCSTQHARTSP